MPLADDTSFTIKALNIGQILLVMIEGYFVDEFDRLRIRQGRKVIAEAEMLDLIHQGSLNYSGVETPQIAKLALAVTNEATMCVLILPGLSDMSTLEFSMVKGRSRAGRPLICDARSVSAIAGRPIGGIVSVFSAMSNAAPRPVPVLGGHVLAKSGVQESDGVVRTDFRLPAELFDGESHACELLPARGDFERMATEWRCDPAYILSGEGGLLHSRRWPAVFPDHEIARVASFAEAPERHAASIEPSTLAIWRAGQSSAESASIRLVVFDTTLAAALQTPAAAQLRALHRASTEMTIVLPTQEAIAFAQERFRGTAPGQYLDLVASADFVTHLRDQADDSVVVMIPGGSTLDAGAFAAIDTVLAGRSSGASAAISHSVVAGAVTIDIAETGRNDLDLSQGVAIFRGDVALRHLTSTFQEHEGALIPTLRLAQTGNDRLAMRRHDIAKTAGSHSFCCVVDGQHETDGEMIKHLLAPFCAASVPVLLISSHPVVKEISADPAMADVRVLISSSGDVVTDFETTLLQEGRKPVVHISVAMLARLADKHADIVPLLATAGFYTSASAHCTFSSAGEDGEILGDCRCYKPG